jgi:hypothetical protein
VDARTLYADISGDLSKAEAAKTADLHAPFGGIQDRSFNVTHGPLLKRAFQVHFSIDR